jgi:GTPase SAR1 family protein
VRETLLISILGDARVGKSVFLTVLISELENNPDFASKLTFIGAKQVRDTFYENYQKPLLKDHELISSTKRRKIPPYAFNFWYRFKNEDGAMEENSIDVIFYDIAGEDLRDDLGIRQNGFNIKDSSGLIFLVDPTNFGKLSDLFRFTDASLIDAIPEENSNQQIFNTLYNYFLGFDREKCPIPMALVLSKADLLSFVKLDFFDNKPENRIQNFFPDENHSGAINMRSVKGLNQEVRELLSFLGEESILNNALGCFKAVNCFAVSSLGKKPMIEQISDPETNETIERGYVDGPLQPFRVKEAFYWILMRHKLLHKYENNRYTLHSPPAPAKEKNLWQRFLAFILGR